MRQSSIEIRPIAGALGAEIYGVDLSNRLSDKTIASIRSALLDYLVIFFRDQIIEPSHQIAFAKRFGEVMEYPLLKGLDDYPEVIPVIKLPEETANFGGLWHSDTTYVEVPPMGAILAARELPAVGGDTLFANMYLAYEALSDGMQGLLKGLHGVSSSSKTRVTQTRQERMKTAAKVKADTQLTAVHPVVRTHPETGRKALYINCGHTVRFAEMTEAESEPLLNFLYKHQTRPEFTCSFRWYPGSIAFWDNRCTQHNPVNDYHGFKRVMHRVTIAGSRPI